MAGTRKSVKESRVEIVKGLTTGASKQVVKTVPCSNEDITNYLEFLSQLEDRPFRIRIATV